jgi:putative colanic acid biosynthesis acetyltransferase WcaF
VTPSETTTVTNASKQREYAANSGPQADPYLRPAFSSGDRFYRLFWQIVWALLYLPSPRPMHGWRSFLLRVFGAKMGANCHFYPSSKIWSPRMLHCADQVTLGSGAEIYNPSLLTLDSHAIISQNAYICGATHDYNDPTFPLYSYPMHFGAYSWICARASVSPGVNLGEGSILALASVATRDLEPWGVYAGIPAVKVKERERPASRPAATA